MKVLLAIGHKQYTSIIQNSLQSFGEGAFQVSPHEVMHVRYLDEMIQEIQPDIIIIHEQHLTHDLPEPEERETFWLEWISRLRQQFDRSIRIVFLCERPAHDVFLRQLVAVGVYDIFHEREIALSRFVAQLKEEAHFRNVARLSPVGVAAHISTYTTVESAETDDTSTDSVARSDSPAEPWREPRQESGSRFNKRKEENPPPSRRSPVTRPLKFEVQPVRTQIKTVSVTVEPKLIVVGGIERGVGTTFIAHELAFELTSLELPVMYIENPYGEPYTFDRYAGEQEQRDYVSPFQALQFTESGFSVMSSSWNVEGVHMAVMNPLKETSYSADHLPPHVLTQMIYENRGKFLICDVGTHWNEWESVVRMADAILLVIDGDVIRTQNFIWQQPYRCLFQQDCLRDDLVIVGNRMTPSMGQHPVFTETYGSLVCLDELDRDEWFQCMVERVLFRHKPRMKETIQSFTLPLLSTWLPPEILRKRTENKGFSWFKNSFRLRFSK
jgi:hypothetical protein